MEGYITDVEGIRVGQISDPEGLTGCTVLLFDDRYLGGVHIPGIAAGSRSFDTFRSIAGRIDGILLAGGSAYGLDATGGVMKFLEERGKGFRVGVTTVPAVPTCIIFDLGFGSAQARPDQAMAYRACEEAKRGPVSEGSVGVGTGATVGKLHGIARAMKGGVGTASLDTCYGRVGALAVVNAFGECLDYATGERIAGMRDSPTGTQIVDLVEEMEAQAMRGPYGFEGLNTTLAVVATEVALSKPELHRLAFLSQGAFVRTTRPAHSLFDGDTIISVSTERRSMEVDLNTLGVFAERALGEAITRAVKKAQGRGGLPAYGDLRR
ncbi:MAG: P1 family peptidase [Candidatus Bipolaricaulis sp.]|nr:P1 family peptidase [Candidatus Bipolaricaulis sp.]